MFVFGAQYLRGATPPRGDWERDFARMAEAGFNTVRAWLVWNTVEKSEGVVDFDALNALLDAAGRNGISVGLLFHLHAAPEWLISRHPQYWYVNAEGIPFEPSARPNTPSGGWPGLCYDHPEVRQMEERFITDVVRGLSGRKEIGFWEPMNEPHQWVDLARSPVGWFCYCPASRARFREWLQRKYGDIAALNAAWGRPHDDWEQVRPPTWRFGYTDYIDFRQFTMDDVRDEIAWRSGVIRRYDKRPVIAHAWGGGAVTCTNIGAMAFDDWKNAEPFDKWGYSAFPSSHRENVAISLCTDSTRGAARGKEMWQSELGPGDVGAGLDRRGRVKPEVMAGWSWQSILHGAKGLLYWQYRKEAHGVEHACPALTDYEGGPTELLDEARRIGAVLRANEALFRTSRADTARVAIVLSMRTYLVDWCDHRQSTLAIDSLSGYYRMFWEENMPVDILHEDYMNASDCGNYKLIVLPLPAALSANARAVLKAYVEAGGTILSDPYFCAYTDSFWLDRRMPGAGFDEVFGCREKDIHRAAPAEPVRLAGSLFRIAGGRFREDFLLTGGEAAAFYGDWSPAVVRHAWGKGTALLSGVNLGLSYAPQLGVSDDFQREEAQTTTEDAKSLVFALINDLGITGSFESDCRDLRGGFLRGDGPEDVFIVTNNAEEQRNCRVEIGRGFRKAVDLFTGSDVAVYRGQMMADFKPLETRVFRLGKAAE